MDTRCLVPQGFFFPFFEDAWGWCTGMNQRDGMGREVGGGFRIGNSCTPVAGSCWCMAKPIQYCKIKQKERKTTKKRKYILSNRLKVVLYISLGMFRGLNLNEFRYYLVKGLLLKQIEMRMNWQYILGKYGKEDMTYDGKPNYAELLCSLFCFALRALS